MSTYHTFVRVLWLRLALILAVSAAVAGSVRAQTPSIRVTSPNGGECLTIFTAWTITWQMNDVHHADVYYSIAGDGSDNQQIVHAISGQTSYTWIVPPVDSATVKIFIKGHDATHTEIASDVSDGVFSIRPSCVAIPSPSPSANTGGAFSGGAIPSAPSGLSASYLLDKTLGQVDLQWTDNAINELDFKLYQRLLGNAWPTLPSYTYTGETAFVRIPAPVAPGTYEYRVEACSVQGCASSNIATIVIGTPSAVVSGVVRLEGQGVRAFISAWSDGGGYAETESLADGSYTLSITQHKAWFISASRLYEHALFRGSAVSIMAETAVLTQDIILLPVAAGLPDPVSVTVNPSLPHTVSITAGPSLAIPAGAIPAMTDVTVAIAPDERLASQAQTTVVGNAYNVEVRGSDGALITALNTGIVISLPYTDAEVAATGVSLNDLAIAFWDPAKAAWKRLPSSTVDTKTRVVSGTVAHLTRFALVAPADTQPPDPPVNVTVTESVNGFMVRWTNPSYDFHHAKIYRSTEKWVMGDLAHNNLSGTSKEDVLTKEAGKIYYYTIRSVDLAGNESANTTQYTVSGPAQTPSPKEQATPAPTAPVEHIPAYQKYPNGTLLRARGDQKIWIIKNGFRRYVADPQILEFYEHLKQALVIEVPKEELDRYSLAAWVRYVNSPKVYEVNDDGTKHWLDMSAEDFYNTGRRWEAVFVINKKEVDFYKTGLNVTIPK